MIRLLRLSLLICGGLLILLSAALTVSRSKAGGAYWLLSPRDEYNASGLYVQEPDDGQRHMLRGFDESMTLMWWSADQKWLYFRTVEAYDAEFYASNLFRMRLGSTQRGSVGRKLIRLGGEPFSDFTPSPDTEWVAYATPEWEPNRLYVTRGDCANPTRVFESETEIVDSLFWSPDGAWLYFHTRDEFGVTSRLHRVHPDGSGLELLTRTRVDPNETYKTWQWSPDGEWIMLRACGGYCSLYTIRADGSAHSRIGDVMSYPLAPVWTSDSQWIIFQAHNEVPEGERATYGTEFDILRARPDATIIENLTQLPGNEYLYGLTADEEWIVFGSTDGPSNTLNRMRPDGSQQQVLFENAYLLSDLVATLIITEEWIYITDDNFETPSEGRLYRLHPDGSQAQALASGLATRYELSLSPDGMHVLGSYLTWDVDTPGDGDTVFFRMKVDGSHQEHFPMDADITQTQFSPLFNLRWRVGWLLLVGVGMLTLGGVFRAILTKVPAPFGVHKTTKSISATEN